MASRFFGFWLESGARARGLGRLAADSRVPRASYRLAPVHAVGWSDVLAKTF